MLVHDTGDEDDLRQLPGRRVGQTYKDVTINTELPFDQRAELIALHMHTYSLISQG